MSIAWKKPATRPMGNQRLLSMMRWIILHVKRSIARFILYFIVGYYLLTGKGKAASNQFLAQALARPPTWRDNWKHFFSFASTLLDRFYMVSGKTQGLSIRIQHFSQATHAQISQQGCIMLGSHLGSFELLRTLAKQSSDLPLSIVIETAEPASQQFNQFLHALDPEIKKYFINASDPDCVFKIDQALKKHNMIGMLGDRVMNTQRKISCDFLGKKADFPTGPLLLASFFEVPVILFFGIYLGGNRYKIIFELFADKIILNRATREQDLAMHVRRYVERLEYYAKKYPYNWFNFYDFWQQNAG